MSTSLTRPLGAQMSHMLKDRGVDVIFGIPGVHNVELYRGIEEAGIRHILARHEQGAGFMADGYARATGKPGVAYLITGPGLCNAMTPMGQGYSDSVSMLVISSCLDEIATRRGQLHQMKDQAGAARTVCDWSEVALTADAAYGLIDRALVEFETKRKRPKHIQVPIEVLGAPVAGPSDDALRGSLPLARPEDVAAVAEWISSAKKPMFIFGGGAVAGFEEARALMALTGAACFTTYAGRGIIPSDNPLNYGAYLATPESAREIEAADLVIALGTELAEVDIWRDTIGKCATLVRVDIDAESLQDAHRADLPVMGDAKAFMRDVADLLVGHTHSSTWDAEHVKTCIASWRAETDAARPGVAKFGDALAEILPENTMIYSDMTQIAYVLKNTQPVDRPGHWHHPYGFGTLGYALPAAIGGKVGVGDDPVISIIGDYGFHYTMQELGVAVELGLSLPIILWDNGKLKEIEDAMVRSQIAPNAVIARNPDFCKLAEAFGAKAVAPVDVAGFKEAVIEALDHAGPTLIYITPDVQD
ncbi:MAG: 5-guanidino-2-oxopentanoate decarboxylase [Halocynthiibacter sp.]